MECHLRTWMPRPLARARASRGPTTTSQEFASCSSLSHSPSTSPSLSSFSHAFYFRHSVPSSSPVRVYRLSSILALYICCVPPPFFMHLLYPFHFIRFALSSRGDHFSAVPPFCLSFALLSKALLNRRSSRLFLSLRAPNPVDYGNTAKRTFMAGRMLTMHEVLNRGFDTT